MASLPGMGDCRPEWTEPPAALRLQKASLVYVPVLVLAPMLTPKTKRQNEKQTKTLPREARGPSAARNLQSVVELKIAGEEVESSSPRSARTARSTSKKGQGRARSWGRDAREGASCCLPC